MAEVKNSFLQSKMNKDLDDRLIPNGEYRDALNISVGKAEDKDIGALEAVLGNDFVISTGNQALTCIGQVADNQNNRVVQFWTDYTDTDTTTLLPPDSGDMRITLYDVASNTIKTLASGVFLNFATNKDFRIYGANILEDLLFWTDNRNQPRKINITKALTDSTYYNNEVQISVAKFAPIAPINVYLNIPVTTTSITTHPTTISTLFTVSLADVALLQEGMQLISSIASPVAGINEYAVITNLNKVTGEVIIAYYTDISLGRTINFYGTSMTNKADEPNWPGDPNYLKDKYVRFSYRYRFDDGEYSLMAPFTQLLFIPNQNGYFIDQDENAAYRSTILTWMENYVNNAGFHIELPNTGNELQNSYKIISLDILYKESDSLAVKVLETVSSNQIKLIAADTNLYTYVYRSQKPYKTLPESQTVRVYDKVPVKAKAQEITGNRVIYGNFINQSTPPSSINYNLSVIKKEATFTSWAEYPNHTLKQNRNYQAGIILADKFGRQSSVILSTNDIDQLGSDGFVGSTIYSSYYGESDNLNVKNWRGNTLAMRVNSPIVSEINEGAGTPGLYAIVSGVIDNSSDGFQIDAGNVINDIYYYSLSLGASQANSPKINDYLRGKYTDYVQITYIGSTYLTCDGPISDIYNYTGVDPDIKYSYKLNQLGWYSYKIVVRQQQQDYYNVYLPGMLNGYPMFQTSTLGNPTIFPIGETNKTAHTVLINDNINKIPRDLTEVGPDQKQYRSSVELFGRVENTLTTPYPGVTSNKQYYPSRKADTATTIATSTELNFLPTNDDDNLNGTASYNFYQLNSTPIVARISTVNRIGVIATNEPPPPVAPLLGKVMIPYLSVYETAPVVSLLDLFWESSSTGLISDLNADVLTGSDIVVGFNNLVFNHNEFQNPNGSNFTVPPLTLDLNPGDQESPYITSPFQPIDSIGIVMDVASISMTVEDLNGNNRTSDFELESFIVSPSLIPFYAIKIINPFVFLIDANKKENYVFTFNITDPVNGNTVIKVTNKLKNSLPVISYPIFTSPIVPFVINGIIVGPIISCLGINGSPSASLNGQQLQWSVVNPTPTNWADYFSIDPVTGVISLTTVTVPTDTNFNFTIRLTDAYNFETNQPGNNSLYADRQTIVVYPTEDNHCGSWNSGVLANIDSTYSNIIIGQLNFWKLMQPGETINPINSVVSLFAYSVLPGGSIVYNTDPMENKLTFSASNFYGTFNVGTNQGTDINAAHTLYFNGNISVNTANGGSRIIPIDIFDQYTSSVDPSDSTGQSCGTYIPSNNVNWKLINDNSTTVINWSALESNGGTVIGGSITPGNQVGNTFYGLGYPSCIKEFSLVYGEGGTATTSPCP